MVDPRKTTAILLAGRVLDQAVAKVGHVIAVRQIAAGYPGISLVVAGDETHGGAPKYPEDTLFSRVAIGVVVASVTADEDPRAVTIAELRAGIAAARSIADAFWSEVADAIGPAAHAPARRRAALADPRVSAAVLRASAGIAYDGPDLRATADAIHLLPTGPLSHATLARGVLGDVPEDDQDGWEYGQDMRQESARRGVRGVRVDSADMLGMGTQVLDLDAVSAQPGALYLIARYD